MWRLVLRIKVFALSLAILCCAACNREQAGPHGYLVYVASAPGGCLETGHDIVATAMPNQKAWNLTTRMQNLSPDSTKC